MIWMQIMMMIKMTRNDKIYDEKEVACLDDTTPADMKIGACDDKNDKDDKIYDEKQYTDDMGEGVNEIKDDKNDKFHEEQSTRKRWHHP